MSHYDCKGCGQRDCRCPPEPYKPRWILRESDYQPYLLGKDEGSMFQKTYSSRDEALNARARVIRALIDAIDLSLASLTARKSSLEALL